MSRLKDKLTSVLLTQLPEFLRGDSSSYSITLTGNIQSASNVIVLSAVTDSVKAGDLIINTYVPSNTYVRQVKSSTKIVSSQNSTGTDVNASITFRRTNDVPRFYKFLEAYYSFVEQDSGPQEIIQNARLYSDVDSTTANLIEIFFITYGNDVSRNIVTNKQAFIKHFRDIYKSKGSERAYELLFRVMFNEKVEFLYPESLVLKPSDGKWRTDQVLRVKAFDTTSPYDFKNTLVVGNTSGASAVVNDVVHFNIRGVDVYELNLDYKSVTGRFYVNEQVKSEKLTNVTTGAFSNIYGNVLSVLRGIDVTDGGLGYTYDNDIIIDIGPGYGAEAKIGRIGRYGKIERVDMLDYGINYANNIAMPYASICTMTYSLTDFVNRLYDYYFQRDADATGFDYWYNLIDSNAASRCQVESYFANVIEGSSVTVTDPLLEYPCNVFVNNSFGIATISQEHGLTKGKIANLKFIGNITFSITLEASNTYIFGDNTITTSDVTEFYVESDILNNTNAFVYCSLIPTQKSFRFPSSNLSSISGFLTVYKGGNVTGRMGYVNDAVLTANIGTVGISKGYWSTNDSKLDLRYFRGRAVYSSNSAPYYQPFSYVLKSNLLMNNWLEPVNTLVHPAGMAAFGEVLIDTKEEANTNNSSSEEEVWDYLAVTVDAEDTFTSDMTTYTANSVSTPILVGNVVTIFGYL